MVSPFATRLPIALILVLGLLSTRPGSAAPAEADRAAARSLFDEGRALMRAGRHDAACKKLEASRALVAGVGILFHLAECYEALGRTASAWNLYLEVAGRTRARSDEARERAARERADALEPKLSKLRIDVGSPPGGLVVYRDGREVPSGEWGSALPIDPGAHRIEAIAPGHERFVQEVDVDAAGEEVVVRVAPSRRARVRPVAKPPEELLPPELRPRHAEDQQLLQTMGWIFVTAGAGLGATGFALYGTGVRQLEEAEERCGTSLATCGDAEAKALGDEALTLERVGLPMGIAGAAGLVAGIVTLVAADRQAEEAERNKLTLAATPDGLRLRW